MLLLFCCWCCNCWCWSSYWMPLSFTFSLLPLLLLFWLLHTVVVDVKDTRPASVRSFPPLLFWLCGQEVLRWSVVSHTWHRCDFSLYNYSPFHLIQHGYEVWDPFKIIRISAKKNLLYDFKAVLLRRSIFTQQNIASFLYNAYHYPPNIDEPTGIPRETDLLKITILLSK